MSVPDMRNGQVPKDGAGNDVTWTEQDIQGGEDAEADLTEKLRTLLKVNCEVTDRRENFLPNTMEINGNGVVSRGGRVIS